MPSLAKWTILRSHNTTELETTKSIELWTEIFQSKNSLMHLEQ